MVRSGQSEGDGRVSEEVISGKSPMRFDLLSASLEELWAIHDYVRQHDKLGQEWDKDFGMRLMEAILEAQNHPSRSASLLCFEEELWQMDRQVPSGLMVGTQPVGQNLLLKIMALLVKMGGGEEDGGHTSAGKDAGESSAGDTHQATAPG